MRSLRSLSGSFYTTYRDPERLAVVVDVRVATVEEQVVAEAATADITTPVVAERIEVVGRQSTATISVVPGEPAAGEIVLWSYS